MGGEPVLAVFRDGVVALIDTFEIGDDGRILAVRRVINPDKLAHISLMR